jgi:cytochrome c553
MKKTALILATILLAPAAFANDAKTTFEAKCKMCHGADGKKIAKADYSKPEAALVKFLTTDAKHKSKVADEATAKALVAYLKALK